MSYVMDVNIFGSCSIIDISPSFFHYHNQPELFVLLSGKVVAQVGKIKKILQSGNGYLTNVFQPHKIEGCGKALVITLPITIFELQKTFFAKYKFSNNFIDCSQLLANLLKAESNGVAIAYILNNFDSLTDLTGLAANKFDSDEQLMRQIIDYISENIKKGITLTSLVDVCNYNRCYLSRHFGELFYMSLTDYIKQLRLSDAVKMLRQGLHPNDVSKSCGFTSVKTFYRQFKAAFGQPPLSAFID